MKTATPITVAAFAAFFMLAGCTSSQVEADATVRAAPAFPPPEIMRKAAYPCWRGMKLAQALIESGMKPRARGVMHFDIDANAPLTEWWSNDTNFAIIAVYPKSAVMCAILVGDHLE